MRYGTPPSCKAAYGGGILNSYEWGDFKGDPAELMERWFDLHIYWANWGTRRLVLRLPKQFVDRPRLGCFLDEVDLVTVRTAGENIVLDILIEEDAPEYDEWDEDTGLLADLAPLRADLIGGDLRFFYLLWLTAIDAGALEDEAFEPLTGIGPLTASLQAFADFIGIDPDLLQAATESDAKAGCSAQPAHSVEAAIADLSEDEKIALLVRLFNADPHAGAQLHLLLRPRLQPDETASGPPPRTVGALRARVEAFRLDRAHAEANAADAKRRRETEEAERRRRARFEALTKRGEAVWREIESEIGRRNPSGYANAGDLLSDMKALAAERGLQEDFDKRLAAIRERHAQKGRFIERLATNGL